MTGTLAHQDAAGFLLANCPSADPSVWVLLLESGPLDQQS